MRRAAFIALVSLAACSDALTPRRNLDALVHQQTEQSRELAKIATSLFQYADALRKSGITDERLAQAIEGLNVVVKRLDDHIRRGCGFDAEPTPTPTWPVPPIFSPKAPVLPEGP